MAGDIDIASFESALEELRFGDAESMLSSADVANDVRDRLVAARQAAHDRAQALYQRLREMAEAGDHAGILRVRGNPETTRLMSLLADTPRDRIELYFRNADRWEESQRQTARRRLSDAAKALGGLDLQLARGLLARVDNRFLEEEEIAEKDQLLLEVSARAMELESLQETGSRLIEEAEPKRRRWWQRGD